MSVAQNSVWCHADLPRRTYFDRYTQTLQVCGWPLPCMSLRSLHQITGANLHDYACTQEHKHTETNKRAKAVSYKIIDKLGVLWCPDGLNPTTLSWQASPKIFFFLLRKPQSRVMTRAWQGRDMTHERCTCSAMLAVTPFLFFGDGTRYSCDQRTYAMWWTATYWWVPIQPSVEDGSCWSLHLVGNSLVITFSIWTARALQATCLTTMLGKFRIKVHTVICNQLSSRNGSDWYDGLATEEKHISFQLFLQNHLTSLSGKFIEVWKRHCLWSDCAWFCPPLLCEYVPK